MQAFLGMVLKLTQHPLINKIQFISSRYIFNSADALLNIDISCLMPINKDSAIFNNSLYLHETYIIEKKLKIWYNFNRKGK